MQESVSFESIRGQLGSLTLGGLLRDRAINFRDATYLDQLHPTRNGKEVCTFSQLKHRADQISSALIDRGYRAGDSIAIAGVNSIDWVAVFLGVTQVGMVLVTLNVRYRREELSYMLETSQARIAITPATNQGFNLAELYGELLQELPLLDDVIFFDDEVDVGHSFSLLRDSFVNESIDEWIEGVKPLDPAVILFTSGTTGRPKGATITHRSIIASAWAQAEHFGIGSGDSMAGHMPFNHVGGLTCTLITSMIGASRIHLMETFSPKGAIEMISTERLTSFSGVPTMFNLILADPSFASIDTSCVRYVVVGGSNVDPTLASEIAAAFPKATIHNLYGLSETSGACIISPLGDSLALVSTTLGSAIGDFRLKVVDDAGLDVGIDSDGELCVSGDCVVLGYWKDSLNTASMKDSEGWLRTGDIVQITFDGHVVLRGRKKEMFIQGGFNVYPVEVENVLAKYPDVALVAGIGVADSILGEVGRYYIVPKHGSNIDLFGLAQFAKERLASYKLPVEYVIAESLPFTPVGKIQKSILKDVITAPVIRTK
ncbi:class I adenylate-forming enzyme family protein [Acidithrix ferrooxidans]|uniref:Long-chain-fatty-acid--CoA ligase n=1 Tax=Acidithrix ferrooxidans TaxID=1280514 RepID=A0A0D8HG44_9ACTN|nr:AMP-binding protein [Acidithrix ferrooxidans]KJF16883.1 long-chain-fatty-acid--CoA ligase [Acidithrix ferrooxidans]